MKRRAREKLSFRARQSIYRALEEFLNQCKPIVDVLNGQQSSGADLVRATALIRVLEHYLFRMTLGPVDISHRQP